jgi:hypothetical protein
MAETSDFDKLAAFPDLGITEQLRSAASSCVQKILFSRLDNRPVEPSDLQKCQAISQELKKQFESSRGTKASGIDTTIEKLREDASKSSL